MKNPNASDDLKFLEEAIALAHKKISSAQSGPFGAIVVKDGVVIGSGWNCVTSNNDPTAHAEVQAIREACKNLKSFQLNGCTLYTSCEPCPMCLGAIYWARPERVVYASDRFEAAAVGFDDAFIYDEIPMLPRDRKIPFEKMNTEKSKELFSAWAAKSDKVPY